MKNLLRRDERIFRLVTAFCLAYSTRYTDGRLWRVRPPKCGTDYYGSCSKRGLVRIRIRWGKHGKRLSAWEIIDTIAHELAHLPHPNHSDEWFRLYGKIVHIMAAEGCYVRLKRLLKSE
jgi:hypothetical protein